MAQELKLVADVTIINFNNSSGGTTNLYTFIDEATISDADYIWSNNGASGNYTGELDAPIPTTLRSGTHTLEVRMAKTNNGSTTAGGNDSDVTIVLQQDVGGTINTIATRSETLTQGNWSTFTYTLTAGEFANLTSSYFGLRVSIQPSGHGGNPNLRRGVGVSWVNWSIPDAPVTGRTEFDGSGDLVAAGVAKSSGQAALSGSADFAAVGSSLAVGQAAFDGSADLVVAGAPVVVWVGQASLEGAGDLTSVGIGKALGQAAVDGAGDLAAVGASIANGQVAFDAAGDLVASGIAIVLGQAAFSGSADVSASASTVSFGQGSVDGSADVQSVGTATAFASVALEGAGDIAGVGTVITVGTAAINGAADFVVAGSGITVGQSSFEGSADLAGTASTVSFASALLSGTGDLTPAGIGIAFGQEAFNGSADLVANGIGVAFGVSFLAGNSDLVVSGESIAVGVALLEGNADLVVVGEGIAVGQAVLEGSAVFTPTASLVTAFGQAVVDGAADLAVFGTASNVDFYAPIQDVGSSGWVVPPLYEKVDEPIFSAYDTDFISSTDPSEAELRMASMPFPAAGTVTLYVRARKQSADAGELRVRLTEGGSVERANFLLTGVTTSFATFPLVLSPAEVASIGSWSNIRVHLARE